MQWNTNCTKKKCRLAETKNPSDQQEQDWAPYTPQGRVVRNHLIQLYPRSSRRMGLDQIAPF